MRPSLQKFKIFCNLSIKLLLSREKLEKKTKTKALY